MTNFSKASGLQNVYKPVSFTIPGSDTKSDHQAATKFAEVLKSAVGEVNALQYQAKQAEVALATGADDVSLHQVMLVTEQARLALDFTMAVRNKIMDAYTEIMRMQI